MDYTKIVKPGDIVKTVEITKTNNMSNDNGEEGYEVVVYFESGAVVSDVSISRFFNDLDLEPDGIYTYDGEKYTQIENWEQ